MTSYVDDNAFPKVIFTEGTAPTTPASGKQALYIKSSDHLPYLINAAGTSTAIGGGGGSGAMTQIQKITNGSTSAMTFSSIPGTYSALLLILQARAGSASAIAYQLLQFNGDTAANYNYALVAGVGNGSPVSVSAAGATSIRCAYLPDTTATASYAGPAQILIPNYASTSFFKQCVIQAYGSPDPVLADLVGLAGGGHWSSTAAITSLTLVNAMLTGSTAILYGLS